MTLGLSAGRMDAPALNDFTKPASFNWNYTTEFSIKRRGRKYSTDFDGNAYANPTGTTYYVDPNATGTGDGSSAVNAFTTIEAGLSATNASKLILAPGYYDWNDLGWLNSPPTFARDIAIICEDGKAILHTSQDAGFSWSAEGTANVYQTTYNALYEVVDLTFTNERGYPVPLTKETSIANVSSNPGSYYYNAATLYVHTHDSRTPDSNIMAFRQKINMDIRANVDVYFENIEFWSGTYPLVFNQVDGDGSHIVLKNCAAMYGPFGGFLLRDISRASLINCHAEYNELDGFAYRQNVHSTQTDILEVNCTSFNNGVFDHNNNYDDIVNGSSLHDGTRAIRLNGFYAENDGGQITDTHANTQSLNLGTICGESLASTQNSGNDAAYRCTASASMWVENASAFNSYYDRVNTGFAMTDLGGFRGNGPAGDSGTIS